MRYWLYKTNRQGGPAGYWGDWEQGVFSSRSVTQWGGSYSTMSAEVRKHLNESVQAGDVVVAYQTDELSVIGFCQITKTVGPAGDRKIHLKPIHQLVEAFKIHSAKRGTILESSTAVNGPVMMRELDKKEMTELVRLSGAPRWVLKGAQSS